MKLIEQISNQIEEFFVSDFKIGFFLGTTITLVFCIFSGLFISYKLTRIQIDEDLKNYGKITHEKFCSKPHNNSMYVSLLDGWSPEIQIPHIMKDFPLLKNTLVVHKCLNIRHEYLEHTTKNSWEITGFTKCKDAEEFARRLNGFAYQFYDKLSIIIEPTHAVAVSCDNSRPFPKELERRRKI